MFRNIFCNKDKERIAELEMLVDSLIDELDSVDNRLCFLERSREGADIEDENLTYDKMYGEAEIQAKRRAEDLGL